MKKISLIAVFLLLMQINAMEISKNGKASAKIKTDEQELNARYLTPWSYPAFKVAFDDFVRHLELAANAKFNDSAAPNTILIGKAALTDDQLRKEAEALPHGAYIIRANDNTLRIFGSDATGTICGMYGFLRDYIGVEFPGMDDLFTIRPVPGDITIDVIDKKVIPDFQFRILQGYYYPDSPGYLWGLRMGTFAFTNKHYLQPNHAFYRLFPASKYAKTHPEYYAVSGGHRVVPKADGHGIWQVCFSNDEVAKIAENAARQAMKQGQRCFSLVPNDTTAFCTCPDCSAKQPPRKESKHTFTDVYMDWITRIATPLAKEFPEQHIGILAYSGTAVPPLKMFPENVFVGFTPDISQHYDTDYRNKELGNIQAWRDKASGKNIFGWHAYTGLCSVPPRYFAKHFGKTIQQFHKDYNFASFLGDGFGFIPYSGPQNYLLARLLWDTDLDVAQVLKSYFQKLYGPAAKEVADFYDFLEKCYMRPRNGGEWLKDHNTLATFDIYSSADISKMRQLLKKALAAAKGNQLAEKRVQYLIEKTEPTMQMMEIYHLARKNAFGKPNPAEIEKCIETPAKVETLWQERILTDKNMGGYAIQNYRPDFDYTAAVRKLWRLDVEKHTATALSLLRKTAPAEFARLRKKFETDFLKEALIKLSTREAVVRENRIDNSGFEELGSEAAKGPDWKGTGIKGWAFWTDSPVTKTGSTDKVARNDQRSAFISGGSGALIITVPLDFSDGKRIFRFDAYVKAESAFAVPSIAIAWGNNKGRMWNRAMYVSNETVSPGQWTRLEILAEAPADATNAILFLQAKNADGGTVWIDEAAFRKLIFRKK